MRKTLSQLTIATRRLAAFAFLLAAIILASLAFFHFHSNHATALPAANDASPLLAGSDSLAAPDSSLFTSGRRVYRYSVIPGGVQSSGELQTAVRTDPVVARHYADFDLSKTHVVSVNRDRMVYVSYRMGHQIFWTSRALRLPKGETLISDGAHEARTRCGNRVSDTAQSPVSAQQPALDSFESFVPTGELEASNMPIDGELTPPAPFSPAHPYALDHSHSSPPSSLFVPAPGVIYTGPGSSSGSGSGTQSSTGSTTGSGSPSGPGTNTVGTPSVNIPEPSTLLLLSAGLIALFFVNRFYGRSRRRS